MVARLNGVQEAAGSTPVTRTKQIRLESVNFRAFFFGAVVREYLTARRVRCILKIKDHHLTVNRALIEEPYENSDHTQLLSIKNIYYDHCRPDEQPAAGDEVQ